VNLKKTSIDGIMNHKERIETCLAGGNLDRIPVALWRHFPVDDQDPGELAASTIAFQNEYDFDLVKVTPASSFCIKDWGVNDEWRANPEGTRDYTLRPIRHPEDWSQLMVLDPYKGFLANQLSALTQIANEYEPNTPVLQTIFSPLAQAKNLVGGENLLVHMRKEPDLLIAGLRTITNTTIKFIEAAIASGISGIFYAIQHAQYGLLTEEEYLTFGKSFDLEILASTQNLWLNLLHLHGRDIMFDQVLDLPVQILNWHDQETSPSLSEAQSQFKGILCGGLSQWKTMVLGTPKEIITEAIQAAKITSGKKFMLGTGCVVPVIAPHGNIRAARQSIEGIPPL
jgi:uroporphyrinogen decarboxylase